MDKDNKSLPPESLGKIRKLKTQGAPLRPRRPIQAIRLLEPIADELVLESMPLSSTNSKESGRLARTELATFTKTVSLASKRNSRGGGRNSAATCSESGAPALNEYDPKAESNAPLRRSDNVVSLQFARLSQAGKLSENLTATPPELLKKNTPLFCLRIALASLIIIAASLCMLSGSALLFVIGLIVQGAMYVHLIELQHSVLHLHAFSAHKLNRLVGVLLGVPMLISFSDFQYRHLRHHKHLGTELNTETFSYQHTKLNSISGFMRAMLDYSRCRTIAVRLFRAYSNQTISDGLNPLMEARIRQEYQLFGIALTGTLLASVVCQSFWPLVLWLAPLLAAEPIHFLLELPEHFALKAHSNANVFENTRSWGGSWFARWYSHNTNYHVAHHFNQLVPMHRLPELQKTLLSHIPKSSISKSYPDFYLEVIRGELRAEDGD